MSRPEPLILLAIDDDVKITEIIDSLGLWIIYYRDQPISIRTKNVTSRGITLKYPRCAYGNSAHAYRLCRKLNKMFDTQDFWVREIK